LADNPGVFGEPTRSAQRELRLELPPTADSVGEARRAVGEFASDLGTLDADVRLAVSEAVSNSVTHAFRGREPGTVTIVCRKRPELLTVTVADDGGGMRPNVESPGLGLGIPLITKLASEVRFDSSEHGTTVSMSFRRR
jgi:anti-sigma regulatory factor (Ser/Thr protein kinase)